VRTQYNRGEYDRDTIEDVHEWENLYISFPLLAYLGIRGTVTEPLLRMRRCHIMSPGFRCEIGPPWCCYLQGFVVGCEAAIYGLPR